MNSNPHFNSSKSALSSDKNGQHKDNLLRRVISGKEVFVDDLNEVIENLRAEAADSFVSVSSTECENWVKAFQYGYWLSQLENTSLIDEKVQQIIEFEQNLGLPPEFPKFGVELLNNGLKNGEQ